MHKGPSPSNLDELNELRLKDEETRALAHEAQKAEIDARGAAAAVHFYTTAREKKIFAEAASLYANDLFITKVKDTFAHKIGTTTEYSLDFDNSSGANLRPRFLIGKSVDPVTKNVDITYQADADVPEISHQEWVTYFGAVKPSKPITVTACNSLNGAVSGMNVCVIDMNDHVTFKKINPTTNAAEELSPKEAAALASFVADAMKAKMKIHVPNAAPCIYAHPPYDTASGSSLLNKVISEVKRTIKPAAEPKPTIAENISNKFEDIKQTVSDTFTRKPSTARNLNKVGRNAVKATKNIYKATIDAMPDSAATLRQLNQKARSAKRTITSNINAGGTAAKSAAITGMHHAVQAISHKPSLYELHKSETERQQARQKNELSDQNEAEQALVTHINKNYEETVRDHYSALDKLVDDQKNVLENELSELSAEQDIEISEMTAAHNAQKEKELFPDPLMKLHETNIRIKNLENNQAIEMNNKKAEHKAVRQAVIVEHETQKESKLKKLIEEQAKEETKLLNEQKTNLSDMKAQRKTLWTTQKNKQQDLQTDQQSQFTSQIEAIDKIDSKTLQLLHKKQQLELHQEHQHLQHELNAEVLDCNQHRQETDSLRLKHLFFEKQTHLAQTRVEALGKKPSLVLQQIQQNNRLMSSIPLMQKMLANLNNDIQAHARLDDAARSGILSKQKILNEQIDCDQDALNALYEEQLETEFQFITERKKLKSDQASEMTNLVKSQDKNKHPENSDQITNTLERNVLSLQHLIAQLNMLHEQINTLNALRVDPADTQLKKMKNDNIELQMAHLENEVAELTPLAAMVKVLVDQKVKAEKNLSEKQALERTNIVVPGRKTEDTVVARQNIQMLELQQKHQNERHLQQQVELNIKILVNQISFYQKLLVELHKQHVLFPDAALLHKIDVINDLISNQLEPALKAARLNKDMELPAKHDVEMKALEKVHQDAHQVIEQQNDVRNSLHSQQSAEFAKNLADYEMVVERLDAEQSTLEESAPSSMQKRDEQAFALGSLANRKVIASLYQQRNRTILSLEHKKADLELLNKQKDQLKKPMTAVPPTFAAAAEEIQNQNEQAINVEISKASNLIATTESSMVTLQADITSTERTLPDNFEKMENALAARNDELKKVEDANNPKALADIKANHEQALKKLDGEIGVLGSLIANSDRNVHAKLKDLHAMEIKHLAMMHQRDALKLNQALELLDINIPYLKAKLKAQEAYLKVIETYGLYPEWKFYISDLKSEINKLRGDIQKNEEQKIIIENEIKFLPEKHKQEGLDLSKKHETELKQIDDAFAAIADVFSQIAAGNKNINIKEALRAPVMRLRNAADLSDEGKNAKMQHYLCCAVNALLIQQHLGNDSLFSYIKSLRTFDIYLRTDDSKRASSIDFNAEIALAFSSFNPRSSTDAELKNQKNELKEEINLILKNANPSIAPTNMDIFVQQLSAVQTFFIGGRASPKYENKLQLIFNEIERNHRFNFAHGFAIKSIIPTTSALSLMQPHYQFVDFNKPEDPDIDDKDIHNVACRRAKTAYVIRHISGDKKHDKFLQGIYVVLCNHFNSISDSTRKSQLRQYNLLKRTLETIERACVEGEKPNATTIEDAILSAAKEYVDPSIIMDEKRKRVLILLIREIYDKFDWARDPGPEPIAKQTTPKENVMNAFIKFKLAEERNNKQDEKQFKEEYLNFFQTSTVFFARNNKPSQFDSIEFPAGTDFDPDDTELVKLVIVYGKEAKYPQITVSVFQQAVEKVKNEPEGFKPEKKFNEVEWFQDPVEKLEGILRAEKERARIDVDYGTAHPIFKPAINNKRTI